MTYKIYYAHYKMLELCQKTPEFYTANIIYITILLNII